MRACLLPMIWWLVFNLLQNRCANRRTDDYILFSWHRIQWTCMFWISRTTSTLLSEIPFSCSLVCRRTKAWRGAALQTNNDHAHRNLSSTEVDCWFESVPVGQRSRMPLITSTAEEFQTDTMPLFAPLLVSTSRRIQALQYLSLEVC